MKRVRIETAYCDGLLGGSTATYLFVTERRDKSISLRAGTVAEEYCQSETYLEKGVIGIRRREDLLRLGQQIVESLGGEFEAALPQLRKLGKEWKNEVLASL